MRKFFSIRRKNESHHKDNWGALKALERSIKDDEELNCGLKVFLIDSFRLSMHRKLNCLDRLCGTCN